MANAIKKARIAEGYPKAALYTGKSYTHYFPVQYNRIWFNQIVYHMTHSELIILANENWRKGQYHFVPVKLLEEGTVPINAVLTWTTSYAKLPRVSDTEFVLL